MFSKRTTLRAISSFTRDDGTPLNYTLVNIKDWCKNTFEVIDQMTNDKVRMTNRVSRTSTLDTRTSKFGSFDIRNSEFDIPSSHHRYDVILLINGVPYVQIELKTLGISPRRAMEKIVEYKHDPGNGYIWHTTGSGKTLTSFKIATLLKENEHIHKCVLVVDRKLAFRVQLFYRNLFWKN